MLVTMSATSHAVAQVDEAVDEMMPGVNYSTRMMVSAEIKKAIDPALVLGLIACESGFDPSAESSVGAIGLMQLMPRTFKNEMRSMGERKRDAYDPVQNVRAGISYLEKMKRMFGNTERSLAAYNMGLGGMLKAEQTRKKKRMPAGVRAHVSRILRARESFVSKFWPTNVMYVTTINDGMCAPPKEWEDSCYVR